MKGKVLEFDDHTGLAGEFLQALRQPAAGVAAIRERWRAHRVSDRESIGSLVPSMGACRQ